MRIALLGTPTFAVPALERLVESGHEVVLAITQPDRPAGRGRAPASSPVKLAATRLGVPVFQPERLAEPSALARLREADAEVAVVAAYGEVLSSETLAVPPLGFLNLHPSLLPRLRGATPVPTAILDGEQRTGVTVMQVTRGVDAGPILAQVGEPIRDDDTGARLLARLAELGADLLVETLPRWRRGQIVARPQDHRRATYSRTLRREDGLIEWTEPAVDLWRRCRAFQPWPGCFARWDKGTLKVLTCEPLPSRRGYPPGQVFSVANGVAVACGTGALRILHVQQEGRRAMSIEEFLRGQPTFAEAHLGPRRNPR